MVITGLETRPQLTLKRGSNMKGILYTILGIFVIIILMPLVLIYSCDISVPIVDKTIDQGETTNIRVYIHESQEIKEVELEEYVKGVVSSEMPAAFGFEALKAQAIAARTKALYQKQQYGQAGNPNHPGAEVCNDVHCQVFRNRERLRDIKGESWMRDYWPKIEEAVEETKGMVATYEGQLIDPLYHSTSGGRTENSEDVFTAMAPYLRSVESPYEAASSHLEDSIVVTTDQFISKIQSRYKDSGLSKNNIVDSLKILERSEGGRVTQMKVGNTVVTGRNVRDILGLKSADFRIVISGDQMTFITKGYGHGVGMSQYGADGMAKEGYTYDQILKHYYQGIEIENYYPAPFSSLCQ